MELQGSFKAFRVHLCCCVQQHHADLHPANQQLPHSSDFSLPGILFYLSDLHCDRSPHPNICLVPLSLLSPLRNFANREALGWLGGWEWLAFVVAIQECAVKAFFYSKENRKQQKLPNHWEQITPLSVNHMYQTPQGLHSLTYQK